MLLRVRQIPLEYLGGEGVLRFQVVARGVYFSKRGHKRIFSVEEMVEPERKDVDYGTRGVSGARGSHLGGFDGGGGW